MSRRPAALLCVLLAHALAIFLLLQLDRARSLPAQSDELSPVPITLDLMTSEAAPAESRRKKLPAVVRRRRTAGPAPPGPSRAGIASTDSAGGTVPRIDWSREGEKSAARLLERQAQAKRESRKFSGPEGTWPSLTKRPPSTSGDFRWREGIDGPDYDAAGQRIFHPNDRCEVVTTLVPPTLAFGCALEKPKAHGDLFDDMNAHIAEQLLP